MTSLHLCLGVTMEMVLPQVPKEMAVSLRLFTWKVLPGSDLIIPGDKLNTWLRCWVFPVITGEMSRNILSMCFSDNVSFPAILWQAISNKNWRWKSEWASFSLRMLLWFPLLTVPKIFRKLQLMFSWVIDTCMLLIHVWVCLLVCVCVCAHECIC